VKKVKGRAAPGREGNAAGQTPSSYFTDQIRCDTERPAYSST